MRVLCVSCLCLFVCSLWWRCVHSQSGSGSGQEGCVANVSISTSDISVAHVPPGTVCIACVFDGVLATDAEFQIDNQNIDESVGRVDDGVLVVYDTENVFSTSTAKTTKCTSGSHLAQALVLLANFRPPVITGETTLNEGDTLNLFCDLSTSSPLPTVQWFSPQGDMISNSRDLEIINIQKSAMGVYTCVATHLGATLNTSINVSVLFFRPPVITGKTTLNEGDTLNLDCNTSPVQWFSPQGDMISNSRDLEIIKIQRSAMGVYTCVAIQLNFTLNISVNVIVQFFRPPVITGETTLNEGDTLNLDCNVSTSTPLPSVQWFSPQGYMISNSRDLEIMNIQRDEAGIYTCIAIQLNSVTTVNTTVTVITLSTTTVTDAVPETGMTAAIVVIVVVIVLILISLGIVGVSVLLWKKRKSTKLADRHFELIKNSYMEMPMSVPFTDPNSIGQQEPESRTEFTIANQSVVHQEPESTTEFTVANDVSDVHREPELITGFTNQCSADQQETESKTEFISQYSVIQQETMSIERSSINQPLQDVVSGSGESPAHLPSHSPEHVPVKDVISGSTSSGDSPGKSPAPPPPHPPVKVTVKNITYAEVEIQPSSTPRAPRLQTEEVQYATLCHNTFVDPVPVPSAHNADETVGLDQILIQLQEVVPNWKELAEAVGLDCLDQIKEYVNSDREAMVEVVDGWLMKLYPKVPTWREIADAVESIGHASLAQSIRQVYITGLLPIEVSNAVPETPVHNAAPPPLPPRSATYPGDDSSEQPPAIPAKTPTLTSSLPPLFPPREDDKNFPLPDNDSMEQPPPIPARTPTLPR